MNANYQFNLYINVGKRVHTQGKTHAHTPMEIQFTYFGTKQLLVYLKITKCWHTVTESIFNHIPEEMTSCQQYLCALDPIHGDTNSHMGYVPDI